MPRSACRRGRVGRRFGAGIYAAVAAAGAPRRRGVQHERRARQLRLRPSEAGCARGGRRAGAGAQLECLRRGPGQVVPRISRRSGIALAIRRPLERGDRAVIRRVLILAVAVLAVALSERASAEGTHTRIEGTQEAIPRLTAPVNDFANVVDPASRAQLDELIRRLQDATGDVMVVATIKTFQPFADLQSYAVEMFENGGQGIGTKGKDNGVLIVLAIDDRQVRIETGYGLEGFITDGFAGETSRSMVPFFREAEYGRGLVAGATRVAERIAEGRNVDLTLAPPPQAQTRRRSGSGRFPAGFWIILIIIFLTQ